MPDKTSRKRAGGEQGRAGKKAKKEFDYSRFQSRKVALKIAYVGFLVPEGFVQQAPEDNTVEDLLFRGLAKCCLAPDRETAGYSRCGRTDKGVSAQGNVVALKLRSRGKDGEALPAAEEEHDYTLLINRVLPEGVRVVQHGLVAEDFDARFDCSFRSYRYYFQRADLNLQAMREAAAALVGPHDFQNLCTQDVSNVTHFRREVLHAAIVETGGQAKAEEHHQTCFFEVKGTAFLYHQVRCMMAVLFMVGGGQEHPGIVAQLLDVQQQSQKPQYVPASDAPLVFFEAGYPQEKLQWLEHSADSHLKMAQHSYELWHRHMLQAAALFGLVELFGVPASSACYQ